MSTIPPETTKVETRDLASIDGDRIFIKKPDGLLIDPPQADDVVRPLLEHLASLGITVEEAKLLREHPAQKGGLSAHLDGIRRAITQLRRISPHLFIDTLPNEGRVAANTKLVYDWNAAADVETKLKAIEAQFGGFRKKPIQMDVLEHVLQQFTAWSPDFVVLDVDALIWLGIDPTEFLKDKPNPKAVQLYCELLRHLSEIPGLTVGSYYTESIKKDGALPHPDSIRAQLQLEPKPGQGGALVVRHMPFNPATWFEHEETAHSLAPMHVPGTVLNLPVGNKIKRAASVGMITVAGWLNANRWALLQIAAGTCPRIDVSGTKLRYDRDWSDCPYVYRYGSEAWLDNCWADNGGVSSTSLARSSAPGSSWTFDLRAFGLSDYLPFDFALPVRVTRF